MTVLVGYLSGKGGKGALHLAVEAARVLETSLTVTTVVPKPWATPSIAKIDAEYAQWAQKLSDESKAAATDYLLKIGPEVEVEFRNVANRSVSGGLLEAVEATNPSVLVVGSASEGRLGQVVLGSTGDRLLHSSPIPLAISPRGYRGSRIGRLSRVTCGYPGTAEAVDVVQQAVRLAEQLHAPLRVVTFAVRGRTMLTAGVGPEAEEMVLASWVSQSEEALEALRGKGIVSAETELRVVTGDSWDDALDNADWLDGEILVLGSRPHSELARVFLGSRATKIVRHSPVPVAVMPA